LADVVCFKLYIIFFVKKNCDESSRQKIILKNIFLFLDKSQKIFFKNAWMSFEITLFCGGFNDACVKKF